AGDPGDRGPVNEHRDRFFDEDREREAEEARRAARPYSIAVGVIFLGVLLFAGINAVRNSGEAVLGPEKGQRIPLFAAPTATGREDGDANIDQGEVVNGKRRGSACDIEGSRRDVLRICDYFDRPLVMVFWFKRGCGTCRPQLDAVERVRKRVPGVHFIGLDVADSKDNARKEVLEHGWRFPMGFDRDGAVSQLYGIGGGPTIIFAYPDGITMDVQLGDLDDRALERRARQLLSASRKREDGASIG
ncbi:MAG: TlpA family protein disulfide reductase, partial [Solirubrobacterales bacterium]